MPLIEKGIRINELTNAIPETLVWGERLPRLDSNPSVLLLADCVYYEPCAFIEFLYFLNS